MVVRSADTTTAGLPIGTVTFLLTDIEGSSRLWEASRPRTSSAITRHNEIIDEAVLRWGGVRPLEQGEGDSTVSVFSGAADAIGAALEIQQNLLSESWPGGADIRVRIGIHTGEAELRDGVSYEGPGISRCARLRALGHGGQTLLSRTTADLVTDYLPDGASLRDLGEHRLRDLSRPERVFQFCHPSLPSEFPPLVSAAEPSTLPRHVTSFIGREGEIAEVRDLIRRSRLITLTGSGGCGKTRLALEAVTGLVDTYTDGVHWIDLAPLTEASLVPNAVATALGIREVPFQDLTDTIAIQLGTRHILLVLDNCEHLASTCAALADELLRKCPSLTVVATSREPLGTSGENAWHVPSLSLPSDGDSDLEELMRAESPRLFVDRATLTRPRFRLTEANAQAIATICRRLDGIPLAIELAAARMRSLTPHQILAGLADRFALLTGGARTALARQRTLEASVEWSHDLLSDQEKILFRRLSVFAGGFTLEAAEHVSAGDGLEEVNVLDVLSQLVERSLVQIDEDGEGGRYRMLETIRDYARHRLIEAREAPAVRNGHLDYFLEFVEEAEPKLETEHMKEWADLLEAEHDNIRAATDWSIESAQTDKALRIPAALLIFWHINNHLKEGRARLSAALELEGGQPASRAKALVTQAGRNQFSFDMGDFEAVTAMWDRALAVAREQQDPRLLGRALTWAGIGATLAGRKDGGDLLDEACAVAEAAKDWWCLGYAYAAAGAFVEVVRADVPAARAKLDKAIEIGRSIRNPLGLLQAYVYRGWLEAWGGDRAAGRRALREVFDLVESTGDQWFLAIGLIAQASCELRAGAYEEAREQLDEAIEISVRSASPGAYATAHATLSFLLCAQGHLEEASITARNAVDVLRAVGGGTLAMMGIGVLERVAEELGDLAQAHDLAEEMFSHARSSGGILAQAWGARALARQSRFKREADKGEEMLHEALQIFANGGFVPDTIDALEILAGLAGDQESYEEAARLFAAANVARDALDLPRFPIDQKGYEADLGVVREALGEDFDATWKQGAALTLEEAVAYATRARGQRRRPSHGWASLTPTETQIVRLVREGLTNPQIAERLFIARGTVRIHLSHVFSKLGVSTRAELAAAAVRREI